MKKCSEKCIPCCDYCVDSQQGTMKTPEGKVVTTGPIGCNKHTDEEHQNTAILCGYCEDFHCENAN